MTIAEQINAVARHVSSAGAEHTVQLTQTFAAPPTKLWAAITEPERLARWFETVEGDLEPGGRYRLGASGTEGTIERCVPPSALCVSWEHGGDTSRVEVLIDALDDRATLTLRHTVPDNDHWRAYGPAATGVGWDGALLALAFLLAGDPRSTPAEMAKLNVTDAGRQFVGDVAEAWREAHLATGADGSLARDAAARTAAFYRGEG